MPTPAALPAPTPDPELVALLDADEGWRFGLAADAQLAAAQVRLPVLVVAPGEVWPAGRSAIALLEGRVLRTVRCAGRTTAQVLGPGDVVDVAPRSGVPVLDIELRALDPVRGAVLNGRFVAACRRWPSLMRVLVERLLEQEHRALQQLTVSALPRVEQRLLAMLWQLAERFGVMTSGGATLALPLSHQVLGQMVGAARPTVSLACAELDLRGAARRTPDRQWLLARSSLAMLDRPWPTDEPTLRTPAAARVPHGAGPPRRHLAEAGARSAP